MDSLLNSLELDGLAQYLHDYDLSNQDLVVSENVEKIERLFIGHWEEICRAYEPEKQRVREYIEKKISNAKKVAIIDVGWLGSGPMGLKYLIEEEMIKLFVFDLDGTIADTSEGILNNHRHAHIHMGWPVPPDEILYGLIGGPLLENYRAVLHFPDEEAVRAVQCYREWYARYGIHQAKLYPGIPELLRRIRAGGSRVGMATLKAEPFAITMMEELGVRSSFDVICGMDGADRLTKADLIEKCMASAGVGPFETCMIGDSIHDYNGARQCHVSFVGVSYGFGFQKGEHRAFSLCDDPEALARRIESGEIAPSD